MVLVYLAVLVRFLMIGTISLKIIGKLSAVFRGKPDTMDSGRLPHQWIDLHLHIMKIIMMLRILPEKMKVQA